MKHRKTAGELLISSEGITANEKVLAGMAGLVTLFISGAVFDKLHGGSTSIGDRVMCGLMAMPLVAIAVKYALPGISTGWAIAAPVPLLFYVVLLAATDTTESKNWWRMSVKKNFVEWLLILVLGFYVVVSALAIWTLG